MFLPSNRPNATLVLLRLLLTLIVPVVHQLLSFIYFLDIRHYPRIQWIGLVMKCEKYFFSYFWKKLSE